VTVNEELRAAALQIVVLLYGENALGNWSTPGFRSRLDDAEHYIRNGVWPGGK
jgi:hypothetical protein